MQARREIWFTLENDDELYVNGFVDCVRLSNSSAKVDSFNIDLLPCHLPALRELILGLEAVQDLQRLREGVPV